MTEKLFRQLSKRPSSVVSLFNSFRYGKHKIKAGKEVPDVTLGWPDIAIKQRNVESFTKICGIENDGWLPVLYPFTIVYPVKIRIASLKEVPVPIFQMLTIRTKTTINRKIEPNEILSMTSRLTGQRFLKKGMEFYLHFVITSKGEVVWENESTLYVPEKSDKADENFEPPKLSPIPDADSIAQWYLESKNSFRFANIMGDSNGIHYGERYAKMLGFERDFSQPIRVVSKCLDYLSDELKSYPQIIDLHFKGPVYYERMLNLKHVQEKKEHRFDLYAQGNDRPCISGRIRC